MWLTKKNLPDKSKELENNLSPESLHSRRDFMNLVFKAAIPTIAIIGMGSAGNLMAKTPEKSQNLKQNSMNEQTFQPNDCMLSCEGGCMGTCEGGCRTTCEDGCLGTCEGECFTTCEGSCRLSCEGSCKSTCEGFCTGTCETSCKGTCENGCSGGAW